MKMKIEFAKAKRLHLDGIVTARDLFEVSALQTLLEIDVDNCLSSYYMMTSFLSIVKQQSCRNID